MQLRIHRSMTGEQRILIAFEMSEFYRELAKARIRQDHPEWKKWQVDLEWFRIVFFSKPVPAGIEEFLRSGD